MSTSSMQNGSGSQVAGKVAVDAVADHNAGRPEGGPKRHLDGLAAVAVFVLLLSVYLSYPTSAFSFDAVAHGLLLYQWLSLGTVTQLFHPYHILHLPLAAAAHAGLGAVGLPLEPLGLLALLNTVFAALTASLYFLVASRLGLDRVISILVTALLGLGYSFWYYAVDPEPYPLSQCFIVLGFLTLWWTAGPVTTRRAVLAGIFLALAVGFHVTSVLAVPAAVLGAYLPARSLRGRHGAKQALVVALVAAAGAMLPYAAFHISRGASPISSVISELSSTFDPDYRSTLWWAASPSNVLEQWPALATAAAPGEARGARAEHMAIARIARVGLLLFSLAALLSFWPGGSRRRDAAPVLALWFVPAFLFFSAWAPGSDKFAVYQWAPLVLLAALGLNHARLSRAFRPVTAALLLLLAGLVAANAHDLIRQHADGSTNPHLQRALAIAQSTAGEDLVIHSGRGSYLYQKTYLPYFAQRRSIVLDRLFDKARRDSAAAMAALDARIVSHLRGKGRVALTPELAEAGEERAAFEAIHGIAQGDLDRFFERYRPSVMAQDLRMGRLYELHAPESAPPPDRGRPADE